MIEKNIENEILKGIEVLKIDDTRVNKMRRRHSVRIQQRHNERNTLEWSFDLFNNNLPSFESPVKLMPTESKTEFKLERENIHYIRALKLFKYITKNEYLVRQKKSDDYDDDSGACDCSLSKKQISQGVLGCGEKCLNRVMYIECEDCKLGSLCSNQSFQRGQNADITIFITEKKGFGLFASSFIPKNTFIMEFVGEVVSMSAFKKRSKEYAKQKIRHHYVMTAARKNLIDATQRGNLTRFINHSCDPNAETQKWTVNGEYRIGIFSKRPINTFEEITINYQFERFGKDAQECFCESANCSGWIGSK